MVPAISSRPEHDLQSHVLDRRRPLSAAHHGHRESPDSSCSVTSNLPGPFQSGVTINNHNLAPIAINFAAGDTATGKCDPWIRASYPVDGVPSYFPGVELDFGWGSGTLQVIYRVRNADWVLTEASRGNQDIEICAGARHWQDFEQNGPRRAQGHRGDRRSVHDEERRPRSLEFVDQLYWGVLPSVQNPSKVGTIRLFAVGNHQPRDRAEWCVRDLADVDDLHPLRLGLEELLGRKRESQSCSGPL